jgi:hypothetical protein
MLHHVRQALTSLPGARGATRTGRAARAARAIPAAAVAGIIAAMTITSPAGAAPRAGRPAATPACGATCANYFVQEFGHKFVLNDFRSHTSVGTKVLLYPRSNANRDEDWTIWPAGTVAQLAAFGLVSKDLAIHYGSDNAFEIQYAPYGVGSGKCVGVAHPATGGGSAPVSLQWCGRGATTLWILDSASASGDYAPLITGTDANFSDPQVLTEPGYPLHWPRPQLTTTRLHQFSDGTVYDDQMWNNTLGVLP